MQNNELAEIIKQIAVRAVSAQNPVQVQTGIVKQINPPIFNIGGLELDEYFVKNIDAMPIEEGEQFYFIRQQGAKSYVAIPKQAWILKRLEQIEKRIETIKQSLGIEGDSP